MTKGDLQLLPLAFVITVAALFIVKKLRIYQLLARVIPACFEWIKGLLSPLLFDDRPYEYGQGCYEEEEETN